MVVWWLHGLAYRYLHMNTQCTLSNWTCKSRTQCGCGWINCGIQLTSQHCGFNSSQGLDQLLGTATSTLRLPLDNGAVAVFDRYADFTLCRLKPPRLYTVGHFYLLAQSRCTVFAWAVFHDHEGLTIQLALSQTDLLPQLGGQPFSTKYNGGHVSGFFNRDQFQGTECAHCLSST